MSYLFRIFLLLAFSFAFAHLASAQDIEDGGGKRVELVREGSGIFYYPFRTYNPRDLFRRNPRVPIDRNAPQPVPAYQEHSSKRPSGAIGATPRQGQYSFANINLETPRSMEARLTGYWPKVTSDLAAQSSYTMEQVGQPRPVFQLSWSEAPGVYRGLNPAYYYFRGDTYGTDDNGATRDYTNHRYAIIGFNNAHCRTRGRRLSTTPYQPLHNYDGDSFHYVPASLHVGIRHAGVVDDGIHDFTHYVSNPFGDDMRRFVSFRVLFMGLSWSEPITLGARVRQDWWPLNASRCVVIDTQANPTVRSIKAASSRVTNDPRSSYTSRGPNPDATLSHITITKGERGLDNYIDYLVEFSDAVAHVASQNAGGSVNRAGFSSFTTDDFAFEFVSSDPRVDSIWMRPHVRPAHGTGRYDADCRRSDDEPLTQATWQTVSEAINDPDVSPERLRCRRWYVFTKLGNLPADFPVGSVFLRVRDDNDIRLVGESHLYGDALRGYNNFHSPRLRGYDTRNYRPWVINVQDSESIGLDRIRANAFAGASQFQALHALNVERADSHSSTGGSGIRGRSIQSPNRANGPTVNNAQKFWAPLSWRITFSRDVDVKSLTPDDFAVSITGALNEVNEPDFRDAATVLNTATGSTFPVASGHTDSVVEIRNVVPIFTSTNLDPIPKGNSNSIKEFDITMHNLDTYNTNLTEPRVLSATHLNSPISITQRPRVHGSRVFEVHAFANVPNGTENLTLRYKGGAEFHGTNAGSNNDNVRIPDTTPTAAITQQRQTSTRELGATDKAFYGFTAGDTDALELVNFTSNVPVQRVCNDACDNNNYYEPAANVVTISGTPHYRLQWRVRFNDRITDTTNVTNAPLDASRNFTLIDINGNPYVRSGLRLDTIEFESTSSTDSVRNFDYLVSAVMPVASYGTSTGFGTNDRIGIELRSDAFITDETGKSANRLPIGTKLHSSAPIATDSRFRIRHQDFAIQSITRHAPSSNRVPASNRLTWRVTYNAPLSDSTLSTSSYLSDFRVVRRNLVSNVYSAIQATEAVSFTGESTNNPSQVLVTSHSTRDSYSSNTGHIFLELRDTTSFGVRSSNNATLDSTAAPSTNESFNLEGAAMFVNFIRPETNGTISSSSTLRWTVGFSAVPQGIDKTDFAIEVSSDSGVTYETRPNANFQLRTASRSTEREIRTTSLGTTPLQIGDRVRLRILPTNNIRQNSNTPLDISGNNLGIGVYYTIRSATAATNPTSTCTADSIVSITRLDSTARTGGHPSLTNRRTFRWSVVFNEPIGDYDSLLALQKIVLISRWQFAVANDDVNLSLSSGANESTLIVTGSVGSRASDGEARLTSSPITCGATDQRLYSLDYTPPTPLLLTRDSGTGDSLDADQHTSSSVLNFSYYFSEPIDSSTLSASTFRVLDSRGSTISSASPSIVSHRVGGSSRLSNVSGTSHSVVQLAAMQSALHRTSGTPYYIDVRGITDTTINGIVLGLTSSARNIMDFAGNSLPNPNAGFSHELSQSGFNLDTDAPVLVRIVPVFDTTNNQIFSRNLLYRAEFNSPVRNLDNSDFVLTLDNITNGSSTISLNGSTENLRIWATNETSLTRSGSRYSRYWNIQVMSDTIVSTGTFEDEITLSPTFSGGSITSTITDSANNNVIITNPTGHADYNPTYILESRTDHVTVTTSSGQDGENMNFQLEFTHYMNVSSVQPYNFTVENARYSSLRVLSHTPRATGIHEFNLSVRHNSRHGDLVSLNSIRTNTNTNNPNVRLSAYNPYGLSEYRFSPQGFFVTNNRYQFARSLPIVIERPQDLEIRALPPEARDGAIAYSMIQGENIIWDILFNVSLTNLRTSNFVVTNSNTGASAPTRVYPLTESFYTNTRYPTSHRTRPDILHQLKGFASNCNGTNRCWRIVKRVSSQDIGDNILSPSLSDPIATTTGNLRSFNLGARLSDTQRRSVTIDNSRPVVSSIRNASSSSIRSFRPRWVVEFSEPVRKSNGAFAIAPSDITVRTNDNIVSSERTHLGNSSNITVTHDTEGRVYYIRVSAPDFNREVNLNLSIALNNVSGLAGNGLFVDSSVTQSGFSVTGSGSSYTGISPSVRLDLVDDAVYLYPMRLVGDGPALSTDSPLVQVGNQIRWRMFSTRPFQTPITLRDQHGQDYVFECPTQLVTSEGCTGTQEIDHPYFNNWQFTDGTKITAWYADFVQDITVSTEGGVPDLHVVGELRALTGAKTDYAAVNKAPFHTLERRIGVRPYSFALNRSNKFHANEVFINAGPLVATRFSRYPTDSHFLVSYLDGTLYYEIEFTRPPARPPSASAFAVDVRRILGSNPRSESGKGELIPYREFDTRWPAPRVSHVRCDGTICVLTIDIRSVQLSKADIFVRLLPGSGILPADYSPSRWLPNSEGLFAIKDGIESPRWRLGYRELAPPPTVGLSADVDDDSPRSSSPAVGFSQAQQGSVTSNLEFHGSEVSLTFGFTPDAVLSSPPTSITIDGTTNPTNGNWSISDSGLEYIYTYAPPASFYTSNQITFATQRDESTGDLVSTSSSSSSDIDIVISGLSSSSTTLGNSLTFAQSTSSVVSRYTQDLQLRNRDAIITLDFPTPLQSVPSKITLDGTELTTGRWEFNDTNTTFTYTFTPQEDFYTQVISVASNNDVSGSVSIEVDGFSVRSGFNSSSPFYVSGSKVSFTKTFTSRDATTISDSLITAENKVIKSGSRVLINVHATAPLYAAPETIEIAGTTQHPNGSWRKVTSTHYEYSFSLTRYFPPDDGPLYITISDYYTTNGVGIRGVRGAPYSFTTQPDISRGDISSTVVIERPAALVAMTTVPLNCVNSVACLERVGLDAVSENSSIYSPVSSPSGAFAATPTPQLASGFTSLVHNAPRMHWLLGFSRAISGLNTAITLAKNEADLEENRRRSSSATDILTRCRREGGRTQIDCESLTIGRPNFSPGFAAPQSSPQAMPVSVAPQVTFTAQQLAPLDASVYPHTLTVEPVGTSTTMYLVSVAFTDPNSHPPLGSTLCLTLPTTQGAIQDSDGNDVDLSALPMQHCWTNSVTQATDPNPNPTIDMSNDVIDHTISLLNSFISRRADQAISNLPDITSRLSRGGETGFQRTSNFSANYDNGSRAANIDSSFSLGSDIFGSDSSTEGWGEVSYAISESDDGAETRTFFFTTGIDFLVSKSTVIGLLTQLDWSSESGGAVTTTTNPAPAATPAPTSPTLEGAGWLVGPYLATKLSDTLSLSSKILFGGSDIELSPFGTYKDDVTTERLLADLSISVDSGLPIGKWNLSPKLSYIYYSEESDAYMDGFINDSNTAAPNTIPSYKYGLNRLDFGPRIYRDFELSDGSTLSSVIHLSGIYDSSEVSTNAAATDDATFSARLGTDLSFVGESGISINMGIYYDGIGESLQSYGLSLGLNLDF